MGSFTATTTQSTVLTKRKASRLGALVVGAVACPAVQIRQGSFSLYHSSGWGQTYDPGTFVRFDASHLGVVRTANFSKPAGGDTERTTECCHCDDTSRSIGWSGPGPRAGHEAVAVKTAAACRWVVADCSIASWSYGTHI
jgi:hypothetical protein